MGCINNNTTGCISFNTIIFVAKLLRFKVFDTYLLKNDKTVFSFSIYHNFFLDIRPYGVHWKRRAFDSFWNAAPFWGFWCACVFYYFADWLIYSPKCDSSFFTLELAQPHSSLSFLISKDKGHFDWLVKIGLKIPKVSALHLVFPHWVGLFLDMTTRWPPLEIQLQVYLGNFRKVKASFWSWSANISQSLAAFMCWDREVSSLFLSDLQDGL